VQVKVVVSELQNVEQIAEFSGTVTANVRNSIASAGATRIDRILVEVGNHVRKGQTLVEMEPSNYLQAAAQLQNLKVEYARAEALYQSGGVSKQQLDQLKTQLEVAETSTKNLASNTQLVSPVSGVVTARNFDNGDVAGSAPILVVEQLNPLKVRINVSEEYFSRVKNGMKVDITLEVYPGKHFRGSVSLVYPTVDATTRTFTVEVAIPNDQMLIRPGMFARVTLNLGAMPHTVIPDIAVQKQHGTNDRFVFVIKDGVAHRKLVQLGRRLDSKLEILKGVDAGEQVAVAGVTRLVDQAEVEVVE
jgi:RND family efflux transporter MFP subunit